MPWSPLHPNHAIERVRIVIQFKDRLPFKSIAKLGSDFESRSAKLNIGARVDLLARTIMMGPQGPIQSSSPLPPDGPAGWQFVRKSGVDNPEEAITLTQEALIYETTQYVRWISFRARSMDLMLPIIQYIASVLDIRLFALEYFDRFIFEGSLTEAEPSELLDHSLTNGFSANTKSGEELWHLHYGWFDTQHGTRVLVNQNFDAVDLTDVEGVVRRSVGIYTKVERRNKDEIVDLVGFADDLEAMHTISKSLLRKCLSPQTAAMIGLQNEQ